MIPRSSIVCFNIPAEIAINNAMAEVEKMDADEKLTQAVTLLQQAKQCVAEYTDKWLKENQTTV